jgi:PAS domain S-box-containing protein
VIFLSGLDDAEHKIKELEAGRVDYITKPFQAGEVLARVETHLSLYRLRRQVDAQNASLEMMVQERTKELLGTMGSMGSERTERKRIGEAMEGRLRFERLLSDVSARFVNLPPGRVGGEIENAIKMILEFFHVERSALLRTLPGKTSWQITHVAIANDQVPPVPMGAVLSRAINPWAYDMLIERRQVLAISSLDGVPPEAHVDKQTWNEWGIRSNLNIPIYLGESLDYVIAVNSLKSERAWPAEVIPRLRLLGEILVNAVERRNAEQALRESEERLDLATTSAEAGIWIMNVDTGFVWVTDKLRELFRFAPDEELNFERFLDVIHPDDSEHVRDLVRQSLEKRELLAVEYRIRHPDGSIHWLMARGRPYSRASELPERLMGVCSDVTQRKMMELQLTESRTLLSALVDSTSDMIWSVDSEGFGLLTFNRGLYEYFLNQRGIRIEAGMCPEDLLPPGSSLRSGLRSIAEHWRKDRSPPSTRCTRERERCG